MPDSMSQEDRDKLSEEYLDKVITDFIAIPDTEPLHAIGQILRILRKQRDEALKKAAEVVVVGEQLLDAKASLLEEIEVQLNLLERCHHAIPPHRQVLRENIEKHLKKSGRGI